MNWYRKSIFTKLTYPLIALSIIAVVIIYSYLNSSITENAILGAQKRAVDTVDQYKRLRKYYTQNVISEVVKSKDLKPHYNHSGPNGVVPLPATLVHELSELMQDKGTRLNLYSKYPFPNRAQRNLDAFQQASWDFLSKNPDKIYTRVEEINGITTVRVAIPDKMVAEACVNCHNTHPETPRKGWSLGDVRGVLAVDTIIDEELQVAQTTATNTTILMTVLTSTLMLVMLYVFRHTGRKINSFSKAVANATEGDLASRAVLTGFDEIAQLGNHFNRFLDTTENVVSTMNKHSDSIDELSSDLSDNVSKNHQSILLQNDETDQVAASMLQMEATVSDVAENAALASNAADEAMNETQATLTVVNETMNSIVELEKRISEASNTIAALDTDSTEISSVLDVIRGIAEQTNLLALNAAIEAARAGDQGRGFAVVADEVRSLANRTEESIRDIQEKIEQLQKRAKSSVTIMNESGVAMSDSLNKAQNAVTHLDTIDTIIKSVSELNINIATAAEEQSAVAKDVSRNANDLSNGNKKIEQDAGRVEEVAVNLRNLAEKLAATASHFKA